MGQELSKVLYHSECGAPDQQAVEFSDEVFEPDGLVREHSSEDFFSPISSPLRRGSDGNTVIIFDWDDTLLCSTAINSSQWSLKQLRDLEQAAESILNHAMSLGETLIVTNGNSTWVQDSAKRFLPGLLPTIAKLTVVSARGLYENMYPGDPFMWKKAAFKQLLMSNRTVDSDIGLNLIALGDQQPEIEAAHVTVKSLGTPSKAKTLKFKEGPSIPELVGQLNKAERELANLVQEDCSGHRGLVRRTLPPHLEHVVSQAAGWRFSTKEETTWSFPRSLTLKDLWPFFS